MKWYLSLLIVFVIYSPRNVFACHPVLKCVEIKSGGNIAYFGFEGGESYIAIGNKNKFSGATGCASSGKDCGQGTQFPNNGPYEADKFGSDSIVSGQSLLPVTFATSVTWTLSSGSATATTSSPTCATPTATRTATRTATSTVTAVPTFTTTATPTRTATYTPTATKTSTATITPTRTATYTSTSIPTRTSTNTPNPTATYTATLTSTATPTRTATSTYTSVPTFTPTVALTATPTVTSTPTTEPTTTPTQTMTPTASITPTFIPTAYPTSTPNFEILDCNGVPGGNAKLDCCGVCGGDGTSCPQLCQQINNTSAKKKIRISAKKITSDTLARIGRELACNKKSVGAKQRRIETTELRKQVKYLLEGIDDQIKLCDTPFCSKSSYIELNAEIKTKLQRMVTLNKISQRQGIKACCHGTSCGKAGVKGTNWRITFTNAVDNLPEIRCD